MRVKVAIYSHIIADHFRQTNVARTGVRHSNLECRRPHHSRGAVDLVVGGTAVSRVLFVCGRVPVATSQLRHGRESGYSNLRFRRLHNSRVYATVGCNIFYCLFHSTDPITVLNTSSFSFGNLDSPLKVTTNTSLPAVK